MRDCCVACNGESEIPRLLRERVERLRLREDLQGSDREEQQQLGREVNLHACGSQVLITVNAPMNFELTLDFLPCFQPRDKENHPDNGGWIAGSCGSLLLCCNGKLNPTVYYICNPLNKQWYMLPPVLKTYTTVNVGFVYVPCHRENDGQQQHQLNCSACRFMVVRIPRNQIVCTNFDVETYSSDTGEWEITTFSSLSAKEEFRSLSSGRLSFKSYYHNGCLHWLAEGGSVVVYDPYNKKIAGVIPGPKRVETCLSFEFGGLGISNGCFWLCQHAAFSDDLRFWKLKGYDNLDTCKWSLKYLLNFREMVNGPMSPSNFTCGSMLAIHPFNPDIVYMNIGSREKADHHVVSCNLRKKSLGPVRVGSPHFRFWADLFTLYIPDRL